MTAAPWLSVIGIGEDGLEGLTPAARALLDKAQVVAGGARHLAMLPEDGRERIAWPSPFTEALPRIQALRGHSTAILASGDPLHFGIGVKLLEYFDPAEMVILPGLSAFTLACARLGWPRAECDCITLHGRPADLLRAALYPNARVLALSSDAKTPAKVAQILCEEGFGDSEMTVLSAMGGPAESLIRGKACEWNVEVADLNTVAIACDDGSGAPRGPAPGLPDAAFRHDGQLTKRELRAITLSALRPYPGARLWDIGAGCGSIAIEWLRLACNGRAAAVEQEASRQALIAENAAALGVPQLEILAGRAPEVLSNLPTPDAVFIGGGLTTPDLLECCWKALAPGGLLVANSVTLEGEQALSGFAAAAREDFAEEPELTRIAVTRGAPLGGYLGWRPLMPVTQFVAEKARRSGLERKI
jgi:precorrin-6Y C5,15-methyltransferase (decarboxylating)